MEQQRITINKSDKVLLLHGFLSGARLNGNPLYDSGGILKQKLKNYHETKLNTQENLSFFDLNLFNLWKLYYQTQEFCKQEETLDNLQRKLELHLPQIIICHSMGCHLLENYIRSGRKLPNETGRIIYCQPDTRTISSNLIESIYSPIDLILWLSALVNLSVPTGLYPNHGTQSLNSSPDLLQTLQSHPFWPVASHLAPLDFGITVQ
jgi:hypothetical protein